jgi:PAP2 superfamily
MNTLLGFLRAAPVFFILLFFIPLCAIMAARTSDRRRWDLALVASLLFVPGSLCTELVVSRLSLVVPLKYDQYVFMLDGWAGHPAFGLGRYLRTHHIVSEVARQAYNNLALVLFGSFAVLLWRGEIEQAAAMLKAIFTSLLVALPIYILLPVCGPAYAFKDFPNLPEKFEPHLVPLSAPPNGVPSIHTSSALLICWFMRRSRVGSLVAGVYLLLMVCSTLGFGEHYFFDLIAAVPYTALVIWICDDFSRVADRSDASPVSSAVNLCFSPSFSSVKVTSDSGREHVKPERMDRHNAGEE